MRRQSVYAGIPGARERFLSFRQPCRPLCLGLFRTALAFVNAANKQKGIKPMIQTSFLEKLETVQVVQDQLLQDNDKAVATELLAKRDDSISQLRQWRKQLEILAESMPKSSHCIKRFDNGNSMVSIPWDEDELGKLKFTPLYALRHIDKAEKKAHNTTVSALVRHLNDAYSLGLSYTEIQDELKPGFTMDDVQTLLAAHTDGLGLNDTGAEKVKAEFRRCFNASNFKSKGTRVTASSGIYFNSFRFEPGLSLSFGDQNIMVIAKAIALFDFGVTTIPNFWYQMIEGWQRNVDVTVAYEFPMHNRFLALKFFKNGRIDLIFVDDQAARDFMRDIVSD